MYENEEERQRRLEIEAFREVHDEISEKIRKAKEAGDWEAVQYWKEVLRENL